MLMRHYSLPKYIACGFLSLVPCAIHAQVHTEDNKSSNNDASEVSATAEAADSVRVHELEELIVEGKNVWVEDDKIVFVPTKSEKNLSTDVATLVESMSIPVITVTNSGLISRDGNSITVFINGKKADSSQLAVFWPQNAQRLEYLEYPSDPVFEGEKCVLNIIVKEYEYGGLTGIRARGASIGDALIQAASKLVHKDFTFILSAFGDYSDIEKPTRATTETYDDLFYDGVHFDRIQSESTVDKNRTKNKIGSIDAFSSYYNRISGFYASHKLSFLYSSDKTPESGALLYSPAVIAASSYNRHSSNHDRDASASGTYNFPLKRWYNTVSWNYAFADRSSLSDYQTDATAPIVTDSRNRENSFGITLNGGKQFTQKFGLTLMAGTSMKWIEYDYTGTTTASQNQNRNSTFAQAGLFWNPLPNLGLSAYGAFDMTTYKIDDSPRVYDFLPTVTLRGNLNLRGTQSMVWGIDFLPSSASPAALSDIIVRQTELLSTQGNPNLKPSTALNPYVNYNWFPSNRFNLGGSVRLNHVINDAYGEFISGGEGINGLIKRFTDNVNDGNLSCSANAGWTIIRNLRANGSLNYTCFYSSKFNTVSSFSYTLSAGYTLRNCRWNLSLRSPSKRAENGGSIITKRDFYDLGFSFTWGTGNLYLSAGIDNLLNRHATYIERTTSGNFNATGHILSTGRSASLNLTYTFDYGKKIDPDMQGLF